MRGDLTPERARQLLAVGEDGSLVWRIGRRGGVRAGHLAGRTDPDGYRNVSVDGTRYQAHRLVWLIVYGRWPCGQIDHINRVRGDNRVCNLREATPSENSINRAGVTGVTLHKCGKFQAQIKKAGRNHYLGLYANRADAEAAYLEASAHLHGEFGAAA